MVRMINSKEYPDDLSGANLSYADFSYADLSYANLSYSNISYANLIRANLSGANLSGANLSYVDLMRANLSGANLSYADFSYADLSYADLSGANLSGANLRGANLRGANLRGAKLNWSIGNGCEVSTLQTSRYHIAYTSTHIFIGCKCYTIKQWHNFSDDQIKVMDDGALAWWKAYKDWLFKALELNPATPCKTIQSEVISSEVTVSSN